MALKCEPVEIMSLESNSKLYYLKAMFGDNLKIIEGELHEELQELNKTIIRNDIEFHLVFSELKKKINTHVKAQLNMMNKDWYVAYYLGGPGFDTAVDVKRKLEELGDFSKIALNNGKMCTGLELMVSPASSSYPCLFELKPDNFELIEENQHVGCGFASPEFFERILETTDKTSIAARHFAIQIRMFCPKLGWFKGMLMKKPSITNVQLPESMMKVQQSMSPNCSDDAHLMIKQIFPSKGSAGVRDKLTNRKTTKSALSNIKPLVFNYTNLLESHGILRDDYEAYEKSFYDDDGKICSVRNDDNIVGVADPTSSLPNDSVYVTGLTAMYCGDQVFITRYPCTEKADGKLLKVITSRPEGMSSEHWKYLVSIPYGILIFGLSSTSTSLPEQIADGDLDGDLYHVLWDITIVKKIEKFDSRKIDDMASSSECCETHHHNDVVRDVMLEHPGEFDDSRIHYLDNQEPVDIRAAVDIIGHHKKEIKVRWKSISNKEISESWELLREMRDEIPETIAVYGIQNDLVEQIGWRWIKEYITVTELKCIVSHKEDNDEMIFLARYEDGSDEEKTLNEMKEDAPDLLYKYAIENNLLHQWRIDYIGSSMENWFENTQTYIAELKHLYYQKKLTRSIYKEWKKRVNMGDTEAADALSGAYKKTLDYRKHATLVSLPLYLTRCLPKNVRHCVISV